LPKGTQPQNIPSAIAFGQPSWGKITKWLSWVGFYDFLILIPCIIFTF
jgi:hypothetical protein